MKTKLIAAVVSGAALAGCANIENYPQPITSGPVAFSANRGFDATRVESGRVFTVRSFVKTGADKKGLSEVVGAKCTLKSPEMRTTLVTPAQFSSPKIKGKPGILTVSCDYKGQKQVRSLEPNLPYKGGVVTGSGSSGAAAAGLLVTLVINAASREAARKRDQWEYFVGDVTEYRVTFEQ